VDLIPQQFGERIVHQAMTLHQSPPGKAVSDDQQPEMPFAIGGASVPGMGGAVVADLESLRPQAILHERADAFNPGFRARIGDGVQARWLRFCNHRAWATEATSRMIVSP